MPLPRNVIPARVAERAYSKWIRDANGCYISTYSVASHGYSQIGWSENGKTYMTTAHRAAWSHVHGDPGNDTVDHEPTCDHRCVNLNHLRALSNFENARRTDGRDWPLGTCLHGHPNSDLVQWAGKWQCRTCRLKWQRDKRKRRRERLAQC